MGVIDCLKISHRMMYMVYPNEGNWSKIEYGDVEETGLASVV